MPSVIYLRTVLGPVTSSNRIVYPTSSPSSTSNSSLTRLLTDIAATRRGCVQATIRLRLRPSSSIMDGIWVVFPEPVSPTSTIVWFLLIISKNWSRCSQTGSFLRLSRIWK